MGVYGYCVVPGACAPGVDVCGINGSAVHGLAVADVAVWVSEIARPEATLQHVRDHNAVIEQGVSETITPVPLRFGQWSAEAAGFEAAVLEKAAWYVERLNAFAGAMEFGLRIARPEGGSPAQVVQVSRAESGTAYMEALRARAAAAHGRREDAEQIRARITKAMHDLIREERVEDATTAHGVVTLSHLVARANFNEYRGAVQSLRSEFPDLRFLLSGPWVPYTFAA